MIEANRCERCGYVWLKRKTTEGDSVICPKCKSPYWNRARGAKRRVGEKKVRNKKS